MEGTITGSAILAVVVATIAAAILIAWPPSRTNGRWVVAAFALLLSYAVWHIALVAFQAGALNVDYPFLLGLSVEDVGSAIASFMASLGALSLWSRRDETSRELVWTSVVVALIALIFDRFT